MSSRLESHGIIYIIITILGGGGRWGHHTQHLHGVWLFVSLQRRLVVHEGASTIYCVATFSAHDNAIYHILHGQDPVTPLHGAEICTARGLWEESVTEIVTSSLVVKRPQPN